MNINQRDNEAMIIEKIELIFENCEVITIPGRYIGRFYIGKIQKDISRVAINSTQMLETAKEIRIEIHKDAEEPNKPFGMDSNETTFDRILKYNDITSIEIYLEDDYEGERKQHHVIYTNWIGDSDYENAGQKSKRSELGYLYILISKKNKKKDYFDRVFNPDEINDKTYIDFHFKMLEVGNNKS